MPVHKIVVHDANAVRWIVDPPYGPPDEQCFICGTQGTSFGVQAHLTFRHGLTCVGTRWVDGDIVAAAELYCKVSDSVPEPAQYDNYEYDRANGIWVGRYSGRGPKPLCISIERDPAYIEDRMADCAPRSSGSA